MPLLNLIVVLVVIGVALWLVNTYIPMEQPVKTILNIVIVAVVCLWLLQAFGLTNGLYLPMGRVR